MGTPTKVTFSFLFKLYTFLFAGDIVNILILLSKRVVFRVAEYVGSGGYRLMPYKYCFINLGYSDGFVV